MTSAVYRGTRELYICMETATVTDRLVASLLRVKSISRSILSFGIFFRGKMPPEDLPLNSVVL